MHMLLQFVGYFPENVCSIFIYSTKFKYRAIKTDPAGLMTMNVREHFSCNWSKLLLFIHNENDMSHLKTGN